MPEDSRPTAFDFLVDVYDALVDWPRRLANEAPFFRRLFEEHQIGSVLDVACGTGRHAAMLRDWGLRVVGADISPAMIARCRQSFGETPELSWLVRAFDQPPEARGEFDAVICIGNSLSLAPDAQTVDRAIELMVTAMRPGGVGLIQVLNLWAVPEGPTRWQKQKQITEDRVILKGLHRAGGLGFIDLIDVRRVQNRAEVRFDSPTFRGIEVDCLRRSIEVAGGRAMAVYGDYQRKEFQVCRSADLIVVFQRDTGVRRP